MQFETFGIEKESLEALLGQVETGKLRLPEFQRDWVWPERAIASLIGSISHGYPVGTLMLLRTGGEVRFKTRAVAGAPELKHDADRLILDGQQRLTSLYQALRRDAPVEINDTRGTRAGWFYLDITKALDPYADRDEAIVFLPPNKIQLNFRGEPIRDLSTPEQEYAHRMFPCTAFFDPMPWAMGFWSHDTAKGLTDTQDVWQRFFNEVVQRVVGCQFAVIDLDKSTPREAVCQVFERVNTGGVTLTVFELLTATYAADDFDLRGDWVKRQSSWSDPQYKILAEVSNTEFLQITCLLSTYHRRYTALSEGVPEDRVPRVGCRRSDILSLELADYQNWADKAETGLRRAAEFLYGQHIQDPKFLPYGSQLIPLAALFATLGHYADRPDINAALARWYWCGVFGELYGGATESRIARDFPEMMAWIYGAERLPSTITDAQFLSSRLWSMRSRVSPAYKGLYCLLLGQGALDWRTVSPMTDVAYFEGAVDIHHIFPKAWCEKHGERPDVFNSIINKTPLTARTNRIIGGSAPSSYLGKLTDKEGVAEDVLDKAIRTHLMNPELLRADKFRQALIAREKALLALVERAMGKKPTRNRTKADIWAESA